MAKPVIEVLAGIPVGTIVAWVAALCSIIGAFVAGIAWLFKRFEKYRDIKDENEEYKELLQKHDETLNSINDSLKEMRASIQEQKDVNLSQLRYAIVHTCDDAISQGSISAGRLRSMEEMYEKYLTVYHGNGYTKTLVEKVRRLPIIGSLDD